MITSKYEKVLKPKISAKNLVLTAAIITVPALAAKKTLQNSEF